jgi:hypothetical protein
MSTTYNFEELDAQTREYLTAVRDAGGRGSPGVFAPSGDTLPGAGCILGPVVIAATLLGTLIPDGMALNDPTGLAMLQTAGLLLGAWLMTAKLRLAASRGRLAGNWVYADPLFLYRAFREQVTVTPIDDLVEARVTHNHNNDSYTNSTVTLLFPGHRAESLTVANERRAEQLQAYLNYVAWARGPEGGGRAKLSPAALGGVARYVAKNDNEPKDAEGELNLSLVELDITEVPEEPARDGRAVPSLLPYAVMLLFAAACFCLFAFVIDPPMRDDALFNVVMKEPAEPQYLRLYLSDPRNTRHRDAVAKRLSRFYDAPIDYVKDKGENPELREGMAQVLDSLRTAEQPVVSLRVTEQNTPPGAEDGRANREKVLRTQLVNAINREFSRQPWGGPVRFPGEVNPPPRSPVGEQLIAFVEPPEGADKAHFDIVYAVEPAGNGQSRISATVTIRTDVSGNPVATASVAVPGTFNTDALDQQMPWVATTLAKAMVGQSVHPPGAPQMPGVVIPPGKF